MKDAVMLSVESTVLSDLNAHCINRWTTQSEALPPTITVAFGQGHVMEGMKISLMLYIDLRVMEHLPL